MNFSNGLVKSLSLFSTVLFAMIFVEPVVGQEILHLKYGDLNLIPIDENSASKTSLNEANAALHSYSESAEFQSEYYLILQFKEILSTEDRNELASQGVYLEQYIPDHAYFARLSKAVHLLGLVEKGLTGYAKPQPSNKLSGSFFDFLQTTNSGSYSIRASYSASMNEGVLRNLVSILPGVSGFEVDLSASYFMASVGSEEIFKLAELPFINAIEPHSDDVIFDSVEFGSEYREGSNGDVQSTHIRANMIKSTSAGGLGLTGEGVVIGIGDAVYQGETHVDLRGRRLDLEPGLSNNGSFSDHGNHTSSTAAGNGALRPRFEGLATKATVYSMRTEDHFLLGLNHQNPTVISSNSWSTLDPVYGGDFYGEKGRYNLQSQSIDLLLRTEKALLSVFSAGNSGGGHSGYAENYLTLNPSYGAAKNTLVVGRYSFPTSFRTSSSYGPARDGRIKPDLIAQHQVYSAVAFNEYDLKQGSSMSTPAVSGTAALLYQHFRNLNAGKTPDGGLIKAILMNTADYLLDEGPTYATGYGLVNARRAAEVITSNQIQTDSIENGVSTNLVIQVPPAIGGKAISQLKVMLYWTDKEASPYAGPALVNNLDLVLSGGGMDYLPWVLDSTRANVAFPATLGIDAQNNTEQVLIDLPTPGSYTAKITGTAIPFGPQEFYLVYSFILDELLITHPMGGEKFFSGQNKVVFWDTQGNGESKWIDDAEYSLDGGASWSSFYTNSNSPRASLEWTVPTSELSEALVRITQGGRTSVSAPFTISEPVVLSLVYPSSGEVTFTWNAIFGAASYELMQLNGNEEWEVIQTVQGTTATIAKTRIAGRSAWMSVRAVDATGTVRSQRADAIQYVSNNELPLALSDVVGTPLDASISVDVLANDSDQDGDKLFIKEVTPAAHGSVTLRDNQVILYRPETGYAGLDTFTYTLVDGKGGSSIGSVTVSVASGVLRETDEAMPSEFQLMANYPNPFNPSTTIRYAVPMSSPVRLSVFDTLGRRVAVLVDSQQKAGWHDVTFQSGSLSSGMYFYRMEAGALNLSRIMLLLK